MLIKIHNKIAFLSLALALFGSTYTATANLIQNGSFEAPGSAPGIRVSDPADWVAPYGGTSIVNGPQPGLPNPEDGNQFADIGHYWLSGVIGLPIEIVESGTYM